MSKESSLYESASTHIYIYFFFLIGFDLFLYSCLKLVIVNHYHWLMLISPAKEDRSSQFVPPVQYERQNA
jgi:hypothetical protein